MQTAEHTEATCDPWDMRWVGSWQPVGWDTVVEAKGIEADLEGAEVQRTVRLGVVGRWRLVDEQRRRAVAASFHQHRLR